MVTLPVPRYSQELGSDDWAEDVENKFYVVMQDDPKGDYVMYGDYESLLEDYQNLCSKIRDLYWETP